MSIPVRDARDRLIELLHMGSPYPLRDIPITPALKVAHGQPATIQFDYHQAGVRYELHDNRQPVKYGNGRPVIGKIVGDKFVIVINAVTEDNTYEILAVKESSNLAAYLHQSVVVRVGLDTTIPAQITSGDLLAENDVARLVDYEARVTVEITNSQEGVDYQLVYLPTPRTEKPLAAQVVSGKANQTITLKTDPMTEDTDIRIRATRVFSENQTESELLNVVLPLKVRANPTLLVTHRPIIPYKTAEPLTIEGSQANTVYTLFTRPIADDDYIHSDEVEPGSMVVDVQPRVQVRPIDFANLSPDFAPAGKPQKGSDTVTSMNLPPFEEDQYVIIQASKTHTLADGTAATSNVWLTQRLVALIQPNPAPNLTLTVVIENGQTDDKLLVQDGQPGVFYYFRTTPNGEVIDLPAYFHKPERGIEQAVLEVDFVVANNDDLYQPVLNIDPLPVDTVLYIQAVKAQTQVAVRLDKTAPIAAPPAIKLENAVVDAGKDTRILIPLSVEGEKYQPYLNGTVFKQARNGNGGELVFVTDPITTETTYVVQVTYVKPANINVVRNVPLTVRVAEA